MEKEKGKKGKKKEGEKIREKFYCQIFNSSYNL